MAALNIVRSVAVLAALLAVPKILFSSGPPAGFSNSDEVKVLVLPESSSQIIGDRAELHFGAVSFHQPESRRRSDTSTRNSFTVSRHMRLRIARMSGASGRVSLRAYLLHDCSPCRLTIDGTALSSTPKVIAADLPLNSTTDHRVDLEIPVYLPPGALEAEIVWEAEEK